MFDVEHYILPGYVFLYFDAEKPYINSIQTIQGVIRCLSYADGQHELSGDDEKFAMMLFRRNGIIGKTQVYEEGQQIHIYKGVFDGLETKILKVDRRKKRMQIEIPFANMPVRTWVEFEVVSAP